MKKGIKAIFILLVIFILAFAFIFVFQRKDAFFKKEAEKTASGDKNGAEESAVLIIDFGEGKISRFEAKIKKGENVLSFLEKGAEELNFFLKTKNYDIGVMVEAIGDKENGQEAKYWLYYVNGQMPMISVDKKELNSGDKIEFIFEKTSF